VVELLSTVIEHLVKGEIMQMKPTSSSDGSNKAKNTAALEFYLKKNFYKTASLMGTLYYLYLYINLMLNTVNVSKEVGLKAIRYKS